MGRLLDALRWLLDRLLWGVADPGVADDDENVPEWSGRTAAPDHLSGGR